jgi:hypothetical protein
LSGQSLFALEAINAGQEEMGTAQGWFAPNAAIQEGFDLV